MNSPDANSSSRREFLIGRSFVDAIGVAFGQTGKTLLPAPHNTNNTSEMFSGQLLKLQRQAMACQFACIWPAEDRSQTALVSDALELIGELEEQLSIYRPHSELSRLNELGNEHPISIEPQLFELLLRAVEFWKQTQGAFNPCSRPLTLLWREARKQGRVPTLAEIDQAVELCRPDQVSFNHEQQAISFQNAGISFDLGAIGKGYAVDRAVRFLQENNQQSFLFHGGQSSIYAGMAPKNCEGWTLSLNHPLDSKRVLGSLTVSQTGIGVSGAGVQFHTVDGISYGHLIDPRTGWPSTDVLHAVVLAPTAEQADALATALFIGGHEFAESYHKNHPEIAYLVIEKTNTFKCGFQNFVAGWDHTRFKLNIDDKYRI